MDERGQQAANVRAPPAPRRGVPVAPFTDQPPCVCQAGVPRCCFSAALGATTWRAGLPCQPACLPAP